MARPSPQLADLLSQISKSTPKNRANATRRKNACGALKILSAKEENRVKLCWTMGVLDAISSVLVDAKSDTLLMNDATLTSSSYVQEANREARNRAVATLLNLVVSKTNRVLISNTMDVLQSILRCIRHDTGEARQGCCTVLLYLAKTTEIRTMILKVPGLMDTLVDVIDVGGVRDRGEEKMENKIYRNRFLKEFRDSDGIGDSSQEEESESLSVSESESSSCSDSKDEKCDDLESSDSGDDGDEPSEDETEGNESQATNDDDCELREMSKMEICFKTPVSLEKKIAEEDYDNDPNKFLHGARLSVFACLLCLVKSQENAVS